MSHGPHQGGNASYPVAWNGTTGTSVRSYMTVPEVPQNLDGITYYIWTDVFFGDGGVGRMNQFVPQLLLGSVLDGSSGPPNYYPQWHVHDTWMFGAHYFFELYNPTMNRTEAHAAYGTLYPTRPGEVLYTTFELSLPSQESEEEKASGTDGKNDAPIHHPTRPFLPRWTLTMGVLGDNTRISTLTVDQPYMGIQTNLTNSWLEAPYHNMCINACWELYGAKDAHHLPSTGSRYDLYIHQPVLSSQSRNSNRNNTSNNTTNSSSANTFNDATLKTSSGKIVEPYPFTTWEQDEGNGKCPSSIVRERHDKYTQEVLIDIVVAPLLQHPSPDANLEE
jgi:hypothetical protein